MTKSLPFKQIQETVMEKWRAETFWTKEPETLKWIESFEPNSSFADIGANIGQYSLYAAMQKKGHAIYAFEPQPANYQALLRNIGLNKLHKQIIAYPFAATTRRKIGMIQIQKKDTAGGSGIQVQQTGNYFIQCIQPTDAMIFRYIKIDVDGIELDIVKGMTLSLHYLRSVLIEVSRETSEVIMNIFREHGFEIDQRFEPESIENHSTNHRKASGSPVRNIVFTRR